MVASEEPKEWLSNLNEKCHVKKKSTVDELKEKLQNCACVVILQCLKSMEV